MGYRQRMFLGALVLGLACGRAGALTIGDAAPSIQVSRWVKGEPVKGFEDGKLYVVEFWATWCGPCKVSIPHLTELARKYKDVTFVGVSVWEHSDADVVPFVKEMGEQMDYHVAMDDKTGNAKGAMAVNWMDAAQQNGIPTAFVVGKKGEVLWIGHPMEVETPLGQIIAGTYDMGTAKVALVEKQKQAAMEEMLNAEVEAGVRPALEKKDYAAALQALDGLMVKHPEGKRLLLGLKARVAMQAKEWDAAYAALDEYVAGSNNNALLINDVAWDIVTDPMIEKRDLDRALKYAQQAVDASGGKNPNILDTLARIYFDKGEKAKAIETEKKAVMLSGGEMKAEFAKTLAKYQAK